MSREKTPSDSPHHKKTALWVLIWLLVFTIAVPASSVVLLAQFDTWQDRALFGDALGAINAVISFLALIGVVVAILMQAKELSLQRSELSLTKKELERQADYLGAQNEISRDQSTLTTFLTLLDLLDKDIGSIGSWAGSSGYTSTLNEDYYTNWSLHGSREAEGVASELARAACDYYCQRVINNVPTIEQTLICSQWWKDQDVRLSDLMAKIHLLYDLGTSCKRNPELYIELVRGRLDDSLILLYLCWSAFLPHPWDPEKFFWTVGLTWEFDNPFDESFLSSAFSSGKVVFDNGSGKQGSPLGIMRATDY